MTFPTTPLPITVELQIDGVWTDISSDVRQTDDISITAGKSGESSQTSPTQMTLTLNNGASKEAPGVNGRYSPKNPMSDLYGKIGPNTPIRVSVESSIRATLEVTSWPKRMDVSGNDLWVPIEATGRLSRDSQSDHPVFTGLKSYYMASHPVTYWALDDSSPAIKGSPTAGTFRGSSFYESSASLVVSSFGEGNLASYLSPTMILNDVTLPTGAMRGSCIGSDLSPDAIAWEFVYRANPETSGGSLAGLGDWLIYLECGDPGATVGTPGNDFILLQFTAATSALTLQVNGNGGILTSPGAAGLGWNDGQMHHVRVQAVQNGANIDCTVYLDGVSTLTGTGVSYTLKQTNRMILQYDRTAGKDLLAFGHLIVWENVANVPAIANTSGLAFGYAGEAAGRRFERLADFAGIPFVSIGDLDDTELMGLQYEDYYQNQILEIEATDGGMIYEPRDSLANGYRTRQSLYAQTPAITVDYSANEFTDPFEPVGDTKNIYNDVFAQRREGGSVEATLETGRLSVQEPPNGIGRVKKEYPVNTETDIQLDGVSNWLLHLGTVDEDRYPKLIIDRTNLHVAANATLVAALKTARMGDLISVVNADAAFIFDDPQLLIVGYREVINWKAHRFEWVCIPGTPYNVARFGDSGTTYDRYDTEGSELTASINSSATTLSVRSDETMWTTDTGEFPFDIFVGGERMTVTDIDGGQPSFVGVGTSATANNASVTPGLPASVASGDLVLILASIRNSGTGTPNTPTNWTLLAGSGTNVQLFGRVYDGVWTMPTVTFTGGVANADTIGQSCAFRNVTMTGSSSAVQLNGSTQDIDLPNGTVNTDQRWGVLLAIGWKQDDWTSVAPLTSFTEIGEQVATAGDDAGQVWDYNITRLASIPTAFSDDLVVTGGASAISRSQAVFLPRSPQPFTVQRSQNGVVKSHSSGAAVRLWKTPKYAL